MQFCLFIIVQTGLHIFRLFDAKQHMIEPAFEIVQAGQDVSYTKVLGGKKRNIKESSCSWEMQFVVMATPMTTLQHSQSFHIMESHSSFPGSKIQNPDTALIRSFGRATFQSYYMDRRRPRIRAGRTTISALCSISLWLAYKENDYRTPYVSALT